MAHAVRIENFKHFYSALRIADRDNIAGRLSLKAETISDFQLVDALTIISCLFEVPAGLILIGIIKKINDREQRVMLEGSGAAAISLDDDSVLDAI